MRSTIILLSCVGCGAFIDLFGGDICEGFQFGQILPDAACARRVHGPPAGALYGREWSGSNNALNITIVNHGKTVATAHGHLKEMPNRSPYSTHPGRDHRQQVDEIDFSHRSQALIFAGA
jgi:hypothetical protein